MLEMERRMDSLSPVTRKRYMHNYNLHRTPPTSRVGSPKRREMAAGALAERAVVVLRPARNSPYAIRQVSEALSSNGSTSMGSVCASTLSLLIERAAEGCCCRYRHGPGLRPGRRPDPYAALNDILGAEDAFGDMDFKVAGTSEFVTAIQLDTKLDSMPASVLAAALKQAREARLHILDVLNSAIDTPDELSEFRSSPWARIEVEITKIDDRGAFLSPVVADEEGAGDSAEGSGESAE